MDFVYFLIQLFELRVLNPNVDTFLFPQYLKPCIIFLYVLCATSFSLSQKNSSSLWHSLQMNNIQLIQQNKDKIPAQRWNNTIHKYVEIKAKRGAQLKNKTPIIRCETNNNGIKNIMSQKEQRNRRQTLKETRNKPHRQLRFNNLPQGVQLLTKTSRISRISYFVSVSVKVSQTSAGWVGGILQAYAQRLVVSSFIHVYFPEKKTE